MKKIVPKIPERIHAFRAAWRELAGDASFAGMTYAEFVAATEPSLAAREDIVTMMGQLKGKRAERSITDDAVANVLSLVVNSVRGTPGYGEDCSLYRALGFVRKSDRRSGLTHKKKKKTDETNAD